MAPPSSISATISSTRPIRLAASTRRFAGISSADRWAAPSQEQAVRILRLPGNAPAHRWNRNHDSPTPADERSGNLSSLLGNYICADGSVPLAVRETSRMVPTTAGRRVRHKPAWSSIRQLAIPTEPVARQFHQRTSQRPDSGACDGKTAEQLPLPNFGAAGQISITTQTQ